MVEPAEVRSLLVRFVRGLVVLVGVAVFAVGLLVVFVPELERLLPVEATIRLLGSDYFVVAAVALAAVALAAVVLLVEAIGGVNEATPPVVESVASAPHPGRAIDRAVDGVAGRFSAESRRERLREAAVRTLVRCEHSSRSAAERRIADGTWTDDDVAAGYLAGESRSAGLLRTAVGGDDRIRRTVRAIERIDGDREGGRIEETDATDRIDEDGADGGGDGAGGVEARSRDRRTAAGTDQGIASDPAEASPGARTRERTHGRESTPEGRRHDPGRGSAGTGGR